MNKIKLLRQGFNLSELNDLELAQIMRERCELYDKCLSEISTATRMINTATSDVWENIVRIAKEISKRN